MRIRFTVYPRRRFPATMVNGVVAVFLTLALSRSATAKDESAAPGPADGVGFTQHLGATVPPDVEFRDESGNPVALGRYLTGKPVILALVYYRCPMLCTEVLNGLVRSLREVGLRVGEDYDVVAVSFDPADTPDLARQKRDRYAAQLDGDAGKGWHFLVGRKPAIARVTHAVGFNYRWDEATRQFAHPAGVIVLTPDGRINRYLYGIDFAPRDVRLSLVEAADGRIGSTTDQLLLLCFHYDPTTGRYGLLIMRILRVAGALTVLCIGAMVWFVARGSRRKRRNPQPAANEEAGLN